MPGLSPEAQEVLQVVQRLGLSTRFLSDMLDNTVSHVTIASYLRGVPIKFDTGSHLLTVARALQHEQDISPVPLAFKDARIFRRILLRQGYAIRQRKQPLPHDVLRGATPVEQEVGK